MSLAPKTRRLRTVRELVNGGIDDTLVVSYFDYDPLNRDSGSSSADNATIGEASAIAEMADEQSWESVAIVTDSTHVFRTRFLPEHGLGDDYDINVIVTERDHGATEKAWHVVSENAALVKAVGQAPWRY